MVNSGSGTPKKCSLLFYGNLAVLLMTVIIKGGDLGLVCLIGKKMIANVYRMKHVHFSYIKLIKLIIINLKNIKT